MNNGDRSMNAETSRKIPAKWLWVTAACLLVLVAALAWYFLHLRQSAQNSTAAAATGAQPSGVSCRGHLEPEGGIIHIAGPVLSSPHFPVVEQLSVKAGDHLHRGDLIATFVGRQQLAAAYAEAKAQAEVARRRLEQAKGGAKKSDLAAEQAEVARLEAALANAKNELARFEALHKSGDVTASDLDTHRTAAEAAQDAVDAASQRLESMKSAGPNEIRIAEAQVQQADADEQRALNDYQVTAVYAPSDGEVLRIFAEPGEQVANDGIIELGNTGQMVVVAEIYETDVPRVHVGQHATITGDILHGALTGVVERIDHIVKSAAVLPGDTASFSDNRIVEARIRVNETNAVAGLINGKVNVVMEP
jgi:HlyD family secretion protein